MRTIHLKVTTKKVIMLLYKLSIMDIEEYMFRDVVVKESSSPIFTLNGEEIEFWGEYREFWEKSLIDHVRDRILEYDLKGEDPFYEIVGKEKEKEMVKNALLSGSSILFIGKKGYGKTTFSKSIAKLLPERQLAIKGCKIHDNPIKPSCFACKKKILENDKVELTWVGRKWIRIAGDPMMTTRQLIGGISIQKIREGFDLDHPEVFTPGKVLKANRGIAYFDELGAIPSALQTLLHELIEEKQITTPEGEIIPLKLDILIIASTNPANYRGTSEIKEPLLDRMEAIPIGPPESLEEEIEIGLRNMALKNGISIPEFHLKILARTVRYARNKRCRHATRIESEPSCRAAIKLFDHVKASAMRRGRKAVMLSDYGSNYELIKLALRSRIEVDFDADKDEIIEKLVEEAINRTCGEIYSLIDKEDFKNIFEEIKSARKIKLVEEDLNKLPSLQKYVYMIAKPGEEVAALEILLESIRRCTGMLERVGDVYKARVQDLL